MLSSHGFMVQRWSPFLFPQVFVLPKRSRSNVSFLAEMNRNLTGSLFRRVVLASCIHKLYNHWQWVFTIGSMYGIFTVIYQTYQSDKSTK